MTRHDVEKNIGLKKLDGVGPRWCWTNVLDGDVLDQHVVWCGRV